MRNPKIPHILVMALLILAACSGRLRTIKFDEEPMSITWSPDGETLAIGFWSGSIVLQDSSTGENLRTIQAPPYIKSLVWSPDGKLLASAPALPSEDNTIILWDVLTGDEVIRQRYSVGGNPAWSPDGRFLSTGVGNEVMLWDMPLGVPILMSERFLEGHQDVVNSTTWSPDSQTLASSSADGTIILWDMPAGNLLHSIEYHPEDKPWAYPAWSPDGKTLATAWGTNLLGSSWDYAIILFDPLNPRTQMTLEFHTLGENGVGVIHVSAMVWSPDSQILATGLTDGSIKLWDATTGECTRTLDGPGPVRSLAWSPDGQILASAYSLGDIFNLHGEIIFWSMNP